MANYIQTIILSDNYDYSYNIKAMMLRLQNDINNKLTEGYQL